MSRLLPVALSGIILIGAAAVIVIAVSNYDGRTAMEVARDERGENPSPLKHCPKNELGSFEEEHDPGTEGETVPPRPASALLCSWTYGERQKLVLSETVLHSRVDLANLTNALNSLPPVTPLPEGEYACPSEESYYILVGLRFEGSSEVRVGIGPGVCGGDSALNLQDKKEYVATPKLLRLLRACGGGGESETVETSSGAPPRLVNLKGTSERDFRKRNDISVLDCEDSQKPDVMASEEVWDCHLMMARTDDKLEIEALVGVSTAGYTVLDCRASPHDKYSQTPHGLCKRIH
jgi:hypothetical protein